MRTIVLFSAIFMLFACTNNGKQDEKNEVKVILAPTFESASRATATAFEEGDQIGLYAAMAGQAIKAADNFVNNEKLTAASDGGLIASQTLYYPDPKDPIALCAYYPYLSSVTDATKIPFSVTEDLKQSDLCYAQAEAVPSKEAQPLPFKHWLSRVVVNVTLNSKIKSLTSVKFINTATDFTFDINTGAITLGAQNKSLVINNSEAIVAPQTFAAETKMLEITDETIAGATETYYYAPFDAMTLEHGKAHSFSLSLNDDQTVTLTAPPQIAAWTAIAKSDMARKLVSNKFTAHWLIASPQFGAVNKIMLTVKDSLRNTTTKLAAENVKLVSGSSLAAASYTFDFSPVGLNYPYTIQSVEFYNNSTLINSVIPNLATTIYKTSAVTFGVEQKAVLTLSAYSASVAAQTTSTAFTLTSNVPYSSAYSSGSSSAQGTGNAPPYNAAGVTFSFPAQGSVAVAAKTHTMTITPAVDYLVGSQKRTFTVTQAAVPCTFALSATTASVGAQVTSAAFTLSSNDKYTSTYTAGSSSAQGVGNTPPYTNLGMTFNFPAQGTVAVEAKTHIMTIRQTAAAALSPKTGTFTVTQAAVPCAFSLSATTASVGAQVTSAAFTLSSNDKYTSTYTSGGSSSQGVGNTPPYTNLGVTFNFPAQGTAPKAASTHTMTIKQTAAAAISPKTGTFTVTQAAVPPTLTISASAPGVTIPRDGATYTINITSNTTWSATATNATVTATGTGNVTNFSIKANANTISSTRTVSVIFATTNNAGQTAVSKTWSGTQAAAIPYVTVNGVKIALGNLVADGANGCKVGASTDYGLYFQFGSLIGWSGGANGDGTGKGSPALAVKVKPANCTKNDNAWVTIAPANSVSGYYFNYSAAPYNTSDGNTQFSSYPGVMEGSYSAVGIGDPCRYYLGGSWRLPTLTEAFKLFGNVSGTSSWSAISGWSYNSSTGMAVHSATGLTLVGGATYRSASDGVIIVSTPSETHFSLSGVNTYNSRHNMCTYDGGINIGTLHSREGARTVRCVTE